MSNDDEKPRWMVTRQTVAEVFADGVALHFINADTLSLRGRPVEICDGWTESLEDAILVCAPVPPEPLGPARVVAACDECTAPIVHMLNVPKTIKRICLRCAKRRGCFDE